ncbi:hypothetical protein BDP27DRAFT_1316760 [Rhodocollybia butyracea]|uniref:Uncharacterized protein n=1 Tax=Rhodocollybia butyracea TaxID=206335 RepID=A0A9P5UC34_9AGAR|nr:hypothetical protein BDP27DRAFT_1316760 [Rhodocollybia butyracea]
MFTAHRTWDDHSLRVFNAKRDEKRARTGLKPFSFLSTEERKARAEYEKDYLKDRQLHKMTLEASPLEKYPSQQAIAPCDGFLVVPQTFRSQSKVAKIPFRKGEDLFGMAFYYYSELASDEVCATGLNYVPNSGSISPRRYEYLGPKPCISGFYLEGKHVQVLFYDSLLKKQWRANGTWTLSIEFDQTVECYVPFIEIKA